MAYNTTLYVTHQDNLLIKLIPSFVFSHTNSVHRVSLSLVSHKKHITLAIESIHVPSMEMYLEDPL